MEENKELFIKSASVISIFLIISALFMLAWNIVICDIFNVRRIAYWEAIVLNVTIRFLFQSVEFEKDKVE